MILSTWKQVELMRKNWPAFKVLARTRWQVLWEGSLRPLCRPYTVQVFLERAQHPKLPRVTVIDPLLRQRSEDPSDPFRITIRIPTIPNCRFFAFTILLPKNGISAFRSPEPSSPGRSIGLRATRVGLRRASGPVEDGMAKSNRLFYA